jgi:hypothetical protein
MKANDKEVKVGQTAAGRSFFVVNIHKEEKK